MSKDAKKGEEQEPQEVQVDPVQAGMAAMIAFEDQRYLVQTVAVGKKDPNGMRELTFPVSPTKQITMVLAAELCEHIMKEFAGGIDIADLSDLSALAKQADEEAAAKS